MRLNFRAACIAAALCTFSVSAWANPGATDLKGGTLPEAEKSQTVAAKTPVLLSINDSLVGGQKKEGEEVTYTVLSDVLSSSGTVLIPAGSIGTGKVVSSHKNGVWSVNAKLTLSCDFATAVDGSKIAFDHPVCFDAGGGASDWHYLLFGILGLYLWPGDSVSVNQGKPFLMSVASDSKVSVARPASPSHMTLQIVGHGKNNWQGTIKSIDADKITFALSSGDKEIKIKDLSQITIVK